MSDSKRVRVCGYVRVSTEEQSRDGVSLEAQSERIRAYGRLYGLDVICVLCDAGLSAKTLDRPALQEALGMLRAGSADGLLVAKLDRLTRSVRDLATLLDDYFGEGGGKQLFSVADAIDTRRAAGRFALNLLTSVAQWERETIVERTQEALDHKRAKGERIGQVPYGRRLAPDGKTLLFDQVELGVLIRMRELRRRGLSYHAIASLLADDKVPTKNGGAWHASTVQGLLERTESEAGA